ncbi:MAG: hypothetical protein AWU57_3323 [Marinobacter sp. T13-3]|nr:MAG: hypothetical protein AWU57_3323 [Marinobacter sp. T13-3]
MTNNADVDISHPDNLGVRMSMCHGAKDDPSAGFNRRRISLACFDP